MDREPLSSAAASPAPRAGPRSSPSSSVRRARPTHCARTRSASMSMRSTGAGSSTPPPRHPRLRLPPRPRPKRRPSRRHRPPRPRPCPRDRRSIRRLAARAGEPAHPFREECPMTRSIPSIDLPAGADGRRHARLGDAIAPRSPRGGADLARPVGQPRGFARAVARRLCERGPDLSLFRRHALPALRGARAGDRHRAAAGRDGHRGRRRRHRALDGRRHDQRQRRDAAHAHPGQALLGGPQDQSRHHHRPARLSYPAREHPGDGDGGACPGPIRGTS